MKPCLSDQIIVALAASAGLCAVIFLGLGLAPAFAATLSRGNEFRLALAVTRSMIYPLCAINYWLPPFGARARLSIDRIISQF